MKKFKSLLAFGMVAIMSVSLVACGGNDSDSDDDDDDKKTSKKDEVTVESLLENIPSEYDSYSAEAVIDFDATLNMEKMMMDMYSYSEEDIQDMIDSGELDEDSLSIDMAFSADMGIEYDKESVYYEISMDIDAAGESDSASVEAYVDISDADNMVAYVNEDGEWYSTELEAEDLNTEDLDMINIADYIKESEIVDDSGDVYVIEASIDFEKMYKDQEDVIGDLLEESEDSESIDMDATEDILSEIGVMEVTLEIDKESNNITKVVYDLSDLITDILSAYSESADMDVDYSEYFVVNTLKMEMEFSDYDKTDVEIPEEALDAEPYDDVVIEDDWDDEDWDDEDWDDEDWDDEDWDDEDWDDSSSVVYQDDKIALYDFYEENVVAYVTIPEGFEVNESSTASYVYLTDGNYNSMSIDGEYYSYLIEDYLAGEEFEPDLDFYTRDEFTVGNTFETNQGTATTYLNTWSFDDNYEEDYFITYMFVLDNGAGADITIHADDLASYDLETLIKDMFQ